jgi:hypothetical protein
MSDVTGLSTGASSGAGRRRSVLFYLSLCDGEVDLEKVHSEAELLVQQYGLAQGETRDLGELQVVNLLDWVNENVEGLPGSETDASRAIFALKHFLEAWNGHLIEGMSFSPDRCLAVLRKAISDSLSALSLKNDEQVAALSCLT